MNSELPKQPDDSKPNDEAPDQPAKKSSAEVQEPKSNSQPRCTRFKKGVSGNPKGRPRKKQFVENYDVGETFHKVFAEPLKANVGGKTLEINGSRALFLQLRAKSSSGDLVAARIFLQFCKLFPNARKQVNEQLKGLFDALMAGPVDTPRKEGMDNPSSLQKKVDGPGENVDSSDMPK